jgi:putative membrane protein
MKSRFVIGLASAAVLGLSLGGCGAMGAMGMGGAAMAAMPTSAAQYVPMAAASDMYEIQSSQLVMQGGQNAEVRRFAQMMVDHHTRTTATLTAAARAAGMTPPPPALDARKAEMIRQLQAVSGMERERLYVQQQVMAHEEAFALHSKYAADGDRAELRTAAAAAVPIIQQHRTEIRRIQSAMS